MGGWESAAGWWLEQIADDTIYDSDVVPLAGEVSVGRSGLWLDLGCGTGRIGEALEAEWISCDVSEPLLAHVPAASRPVRSRLPNLSWLAPRSLSGALAVLVIEHLPDLDELFRHVYRVVEPRGSLGVVMNHPAFTAEGSGPILDLDDDEVLWRWGRYFAPHVVEVPGSSGIVFHHRPLADVLSVAARCGWVLERMVERGLSTHAVQHHPGYVGQEHIPRLLGLRWRRG